MINQIMRLAEDMAEKYATRDPEQICRQMGIPIIFTELPESMSGFYMENGNARVIVISEALSEPYIPACIAHELGHALLHKGVNSIFLSDHTNLVVGKYEREADLFAVALLVDTTQPNSTMETVESISAATGLPAYAVEIWKNCR